MRLQLEGRIGSEPNALNIDIRNIGTYSQNGEHYLYTATGRNGGLNVYELTPSGEFPTSITSLYYSENLQNSLTHATKFVQIGTTPNLIFGSDQDHLIGATLTNSGRLGTVSNIDISHLQSADISALETIALANDHALYIADQTSGKIQAYTVAISGEISHISETNTLESGPVDQGQILLASGQFSQTSILVAAGPSTQTVTSYRVNSATGVLTHEGTSGAVGGLGIDAPSALEVLTAHGQNWVIVAGAGSSSLSVMRLEADGALIATDHIIDSLTTRFQGVQAMSVVQVENQVFVIAGGADDGLSLLSLLPDGRLVHLQTLVNSIGSGLENVSTISATHVGNHIQVFATSQTHPGITQLNIPLEQIGMVKTGHEDGGSVQYGTQRADLLVSGGEDADTLVGLDGDDILVAGHGDTAMTGGSGADLFVMRAGGYHVTITDFENGVDRLDLSHFPMLRHTSQLSFVTTSTGALISFRDDSLTVNSKSGGPLSILDIFPRGLDTPDRSFVLIDPDGESLASASTGGFLKGTDGNDSATGSAANDTIWTQAGDDTAKGLAGDDNIGGGDGADHLEGGWGLDTIFGGAGDDTLYGNGGVDNLWAGAGRDLIFGGAGDDNIGGSTGDDVIWGELGRDLIFGDWGDDTVHGGDGVDTLWAGGGHDLVNGGSHDDAIGGGTGHDTLNGDSGNDILFGHTGDDHMNGGDGNDTLWAWDGQDTLEGGGGGDVLGSGRGDDLMTGGLGADTFIFGDNYGQDRVTDFTPDEDLLQIYDPTMAFEDLILTATPAGARVNYGGGEIFLDMVNPEDLSASDFLFAW
nr:hypothetical protein [uncultured Shimia sp.]